MTHQEPHDPPQRPQRLSEVDDAFRGPVHGGAPDRGRERVGVVHLGVLLTLHAAAHKVVTSFFFIPLGGAPRAGGGGPSPRPPRLADQAAAPAPGWPPLPAVFAVCSAAHSRSHSATNRATSAASSRANVTTCG